jgi:hypothetical protein
VIQKTKFFFILGLMIFSLTNTFAAPGLLVPIVLTIENGNYESSSVTVKKNGATVFSVPGQKNLKLKLEFNSDYILSFTKDGYITKLIHINTTMPEARIKAVVDPYKIGVRLFKQYEGVNIVVYNQPVAFIKYIATEDELGYDVDYTKSILSLLEKAETELEAKAKEERDQQKKLEQEKKQIKKINNDVATTVEPEIASNTIRNKDSLIRISQPNEESVAVSNQSQNKPLQVSSGEDERSPIIPNSGGEEIKNSLTPSIGNDVMNSIHPIIGEEKLKASIAPNSGQDDYQLPVSGRVLKEKKVNFSIEKNRTITTVEIIEGNKITTFRKVVYNWGGKFYFKLPDVSISDQIFFLYTGQQ